MASADWGLGFAHTAIVEVDHSTPPQKLFDMRVYDPDPNSLGRGSTAASASRACTQRTSWIVADTDADGVVDTADNCTFTLNPNQRDTDSDGYGSICDPDFNNDGIVELADDHILLGSRWQSTDRERGSRWRRPGELERSLSLFNELFGCARTKRRSLTEACNYSGRRLEM